MIPSDHWFSSNQANGYGTVTLRVVAEVLAWYADEIMDIDFDCDTEEHRAVAERVKKRIATELREASHLLHADIARHE